MVILQICCVCISIAREPKKVILHQSWWAKVSHVSCRNADCANSYIWEGKGQLSWAWHYTWAPMLMQGRAMESRASSQHVRPAVGLSWSWRTSSTIVVSVTRACQFWRCHLCLSHGCLRCSQDVNRRTEAVLWWQHILLTYLYLLASNFIVWNETIKGNSDKHNYWPSASSSKGMWAWRKMQVVSKSFTKDVVPANWLHNALWFFFTVSVLILNSIRWQCSHSDIFNCTLHHALQLHSIRTATSTQSLINVHSAEMVVVYFPLCRCGCG